MVDAYASLQSAISTPEGLKFSTKELYFSGQPVGTSSPTQSVTLTNASTSPINLSFIVSSEFGGTESCPPTLSAGQTCAVNVKMSPASLGERDGYLQIVSDAPGSPHVIRLLGLATAAQAGSNMALYFPHVDTTYGWQTEIAIINTSTSQSITGTLRALNNQGQLIETKAVTLPAHGRRQITVANEFTNHTSIGYIVFDSNSTTVQGYTKFYKDGVYRVAIPAVKEVNTGDIYITHIDSSAQWWTGVSLVNTTATAKTLTINFSDGQTRQVTLAANEHRAFAIRELFNNQPQPGIKSAVITNASGVIGLELFGSFLGGNQLEGILLTDKTASTLYYPHVAGDDWWTGIVAYNPSDLACTITITPYNAQGTSLTPSTLSIPGKAKYVGTVTGLGLPAQTAWFKIDSTRPLSGFELIGTNDFEQLAGYAGNGGTGAKAGVFAKIEKYGWTTIALVNTENSTASVTLTAYTDNGTAVASTQLSIGSHAKMANSAEGFFSQNITNATYIAYTSDRNMVGLQLNGSMDWTMLDGLPALGGTN